jgi:hypothetical protein
MDAEFHEDGRTIDLISIGMVREDGAEYYAISADFDLQRAQAHPWLAQHVLPLLDPQYTWKPRGAIAREILTFAGPSPEWWAYYGAYDHVALCQLYGPMIALPAAWPKYSRDLKQWADALGNPTLPTQESGEHNALSDARWNAAVYDFLAGLNR